MYSFLTVRERVFLLTPAMVASVVAGGVAPIMTHVVGKVFDAFAKYPPSDPRLLSSVSLSAFQLVALGCASLGLSSVSSVLWISTAELNLQALRKTLYHAVLSSNRPPNPAAHMATFAKETDDIRAASSLASAFIIQHLTTTLASLVLAFLRSYSLTFVILASLPVLILIQSLSQSFASPLIAQERSHSAKASASIDTALSAIDSVKAFNAQHTELSRAMSAFLALKLSSSRLCRIWGLTSGSAQFVMMSMFVQAFWYGAKLVRDHKNSPGDIMAVFWACLIATSNLQMCIPRWIVYAKGKFAFANMISHIHPSPSPPSNDPPLSPTSKRPRSLRKITPSRCIGELALHNVTFSYNPVSNPTLDSLSLFLPAHELTFLIGSSGSGKSTVAQLLLAFQSPQPGNGHVTIDEQDLRFLDHSWIRENVMLIGQAIGAGPGGDPSDDHAAGAASYGTCILFPQKSIFDNVALALSPDPSNVPFQRVVEACRAAMLHEFVIDLPDGYDTILGSGNDKEGGGVQLSGGQKQRLMLARARLRNPPILILDEATSALDPPTRILVLSALRRWRMNKTTIVISHELSQIEPQDFVYVLKGGKVVEQGFRGDLEGVVDQEFDDGKGEFRRMMASQGVARSVPTPTVEPEQEEELEDEEPSVPVPASLKHQSMLALRPLTFGNWNWMFDAVAELTRPPTLDPPPPTELAVPELAYLPPGTTGKRNTLSSRLSRLAIPSQPQTQTRPPLPPLQPRRPSSALFPNTPLTVGTFMNDRKSRRFSAPGQTPTSATFTVVDREWEDVELKGSDSKEDYDSWWERQKVWEKQEEEEFEKEKKAIARSGSVVHEKRRQMSRGAIMDIKVAKEDDPTPKPTSTTQNPPSFFRTTLQTLPTIPSKPLFVFTLLLCALSGLMTPIFSFLLSRLLFEVSEGGTNTKVINKFGGILLMICAFDGIFLGSKYALMEIVSMKWVTKVRERALERVLAQDRTWFDGYSPDDKQTTHSHTTQTIIQTLIKDADDARALISVVYGQTFVVVTMLSTGLIWALILGWQLTLAGLAIAPVFAIVMALQSRFSSLSEARNKAAKESISKAYYDALKHVYAVRALGGSGFRVTYERVFERSVENAMKAGVKGAFVEGSGYGVASGMIYFAEAMLFYVGALLMKKGVFGYLRMVEVLNLVVFSVSIGAQLMAFTEKIAKSTQATASLLTLSSLSDQDTSESKGDLRPAHLSLPIEFSNVSFSYPSRPTQPVLRNFNLRIQPGELVALVGASGCGKSTVVGLMQRLYEPTGGSVSIGEERLSTIDVNWLRERLAVVSQAPVLFDTSVGENIRYGSSGISDVDIRTAAKWANVHEVVMELGEGYDTVLGTSGAGGLSGGQAQRVQIARALARMVHEGGGADVLLIDEGTSALDGENEGVVLDAVRALVSSEKVRSRKRTVMMVTHKLEVMRLCDRIVVVGNGRVVEEGKFEELMERKGEFARLAGGGVWES